MINQNQKPGPNQFAAMDGFVPGARPNMLDPRHQLQARYPGIEVDMLPVQTGGPESHIPEGHYALRANDPGHVAVEQAAAEALNEK